MVEIAIAAYGPHLILMTILQGRCYYWELPNEEIEMDSLGNLPHTTQLLSNKHLGF